MAESSLEFVEVKTLHGGSGGISGGQFKPWTSQLYIYDRPTQFQMDSEANVAVVSQSTHASVWKSSSVSIIRTCEMYV